MEKTIPITVRPRRVRPEEIVLEDEQDELAAHIPPAPVLRTKVEKRAVKFLMNMLHTKLELIVFESHVDLGGPYPINQEVVRIVRELLHKKGYKVEHIQQNLLRVSW